MTKIQGYNVASAKSSADRAAVGAFIRRGKAKKSDRCTIVVFHRRGGGPVAVQRCEGRRLKATSR